MSPLVHDSFVVRLWESRRGDHLFLCIYWGRSDWRKDRQNGQTANTSEKLYHKKSPLLTLYGSDCNTLQPRRYRLCLRLPEFLQVCARSDQLHWAARSTHMMLGTCVWCCGPQGIDALLAPATIKRMPRSNIADRVAHTHLRQVKRVNSGAAMKNPTTMKTAPTIVCKASGRTNVALGPVKADANRADPDIRLEHRRSAPNKADLLRELRRK